MKSIHYRIETGTTSQRVYTMSNKKQLPGGGILAFVAILATLSFTLLVTSCQTGPPDIPEGLSQAEMFQRAQEAADSEKWETALAYYNTFLERYPDDRANGVAAQYEIAFIHYKMGRYATSEQEFNALLARYEGDQADQLPAWPRVLSEKVLKKVQEKRQELQGSGASDGNQSTAPSDSTESTSP